MRSFAALSIGLMALIVARGVSTAAYVSAPVDFGASHVIDSAGALGDREAEVTARTSRPLTSTNNDKSPQTHRRWRHPLPTN